MGREMGGRFKREGIYVYLGLIHVEVWQKTTKFCKAIILQLKNKQYFLKSYVKIEHYETGHKSRNGVEQKGKGTAVRSHWTEENTVVYIRRFPENLCTLLVGMEIGAATAENIMEVPQKIKNSKTIWCRNSSPGYISKKKKVTGYPW